MSPNQEFIVALLTNGAWPVVVLVLGFVFRKTLRGVLERITAFEGLGTKLDFAESIKRIDVEADALELESVDDGEEPVSPDEDEQSPGRSPRPVGHFVRRAIDESAPSAIMDSWADIEGQVQDLYHLALRKGLLDGIASNNSRSRGLSLREVLSQLATAQILRESEVRFLGELRETRNRVAHEPSVRPSEGQALTYLEGVETANNILDRADGRAFALYRLKDPTATEEEFG